ncbi:MAG: hypothetical protein GY847_36385 [Proteobacteria bacterium]|nr:hypothetical protein [Pseudomonadota bacterium]
MLLVTRSYPDTKNRVKRAMGRVALIAGLIFISCGKQKTEVKPNPTQKETGIQDEKADDTDSPNTSLSLDRAGDIALVKAEVKGFEKLPLKTKKLIYYHYLAALAGDNIFYGQLGPKHLVIKQVLEGILAIQNHLPGTIRSKIESYTKLFFINHGNHDNWTGKKELPTFIPGELAAAAQIALDKGIDLGTEDLEDVKLDANRLERLEALLAGIRPQIFNRNFKPLRINRKPPNDRDILSASANNFYENVTSADLEGFTEHNPLNSRLAKVDGKVVEQVYRAGREGIKPGLFAEELKEIVKHLSNGIALMNPSEQKAMKHLIDFFETGDLGSLNEYKKLWTRVDHEVDTTIGFIEQSVDPRGQKGSFKAIVTVRDPNMTELIQKLAEQAAYFEQQMPWDNKFKKKPKDIHISAPNAFQVVMATGHDVPVTVNKINPFNKYKIGKGHRYKNLYLTNILYAANRMVALKSIPEFSVDKSVQDRRQKCLEHNTATHIALREVIGRGSGMMNHKIKGELEKYLKEYTESIEEMRIELVALYCVFDPKSVEIGIFSEKGCAEAMYDSYASNMLEQLARIGDAPRIIKADMQGKQAIVQYAIEKGAIEILEKQGHFFTRIINYQAMRDVIGELLREVQRIKSVGDLEAAKKLITGYGTNIVERWRKDIQMRYRALELPGSVAFVYPLLKPRLNRNGEIENIELFHSRNFLERQHILAGKY